MKYMEDHLKLDRSFLDCVSNLKAERIPFGPKTKYRHEMFVQFSTTEARDVVRGTASNLAGMGADYGIRLEVPNFLKPAMKALQTVSYDIRQ